MRSIFIVLLLVTAAAAKAQIALPLTYSDYARRQAFTRDIHLQDSVSHKKWFFSTYTSVSTGVSFYRGGHATSFSVPLGAQLSYKLNNNLYAFAGVSVAPGYIRFNQTIPAPGGLKAWQNTAGLQQNVFGAYSRAEMGLMYMNDEKTFSISGSIGIERSSYPVMPYYQPYRNPAAVASPN